MSVKRPSMPIVKRISPFSGDVHYSNYTYDPRSPYIEKQEAIENAADWFYSSFAYRKKVTITNPLASAMSNVPSLLIVDFVSAKMNADFSDLRFTAIIDAVETELLYLFETYSSSSKARIFLKVPSIAASADVTCYMYYGNSGASTTQDRTWMFGSFNFNSDEGLTWKDNGTLEDYGNSSGALRSNANQIDTVAMTLGNASFAYKTTSTIATGNVWKLRARLKFLTANPNSTLVAVSSAAEIQFETADQNCIGFAFYTSKAYIAASLGTSLSSTISPTARTTDTWYQFEILKNGTSAVLKVYADDTGSVLETFPSLDVTSYDSSKSLLHSALTFRSSTRVASSSIDDVLLMKAYSSDPTYSFDSEEARPY